MFGFLPACAADVETSRLCFAITSLSEAESAFRVNALPDGKAVLASGGSDATTKFIGSPKAPVDATKAKTPLKADGSWIFENRTDHFIDVLLEK
jgi:hypothetical protein